MASKYQDTNSMNRWIKLVIFLLLLYFHQGKKSKNPRRPFIVSLILIIIMIACRARKLMNID